MTEAFAASPLARATGLALIQFLWQGALIGAGTAGLLIAFRRSTAQARYVIACLGLALMIATPVVTVTSYLREAPTTAAAGPTAHAASFLKTPVAPIASGAVELTPAMGIVGPFREQIERWLPLVLMTWGLGVIVLALHLFRGWVLLWRIRQRATTLERGGWPAIARIVATRLGIERPVRLAESALVEVPAVIGWFRPVILMPVAALAGLSQPDLEAILAHELAHVRRGDYLVNIGQCVVEVLLFYHPAIWWVSGQIRLEREHCCDDLAASLCEDRLVYARALASLEELRGETPKLAMAATRGHLLNRVRRLVEPGTPSGPRWSGGFMMSVVLTVLLFAGSSQIRSMPADVSAAMPPVLALAPPPVAHVVDVPAPVAPRMKPRALPVRAASNSTTVTPTPPSDPVARVAGQISGEVRDELGGVLPGAWVTATSVATPDAKPSVATTNAMGRFHIDDLADGSYELAVSLSGFRTFKARVQITPNDTVSAGIQLRIGAVTTTVNVTAARPPSASQPRDAMTAPYPPAAVPPSAAAEDQITPIPPPAPGAPIRVGGSITQPRQIQRVEPTYPAIAVAAMVTGRVVIEANIDKEGAIKDPKVVSGQPLLDAAALDAVRQWQFAPTRLDGALVEVMITVTVTFTLK